MKNDDPGPKSHGGITLYLLDRSKKTDKLAEFKFSLMHLGLKVSMVERIRPDNSIESKISITNVTMALLPQIVHILQDSALEINQDK